MKIVVLCSPYRGKTPEDVAENLTYLNRCLRDSIERGEAPIASHKLYPGALNDDLAEERALGMELQNFFIGCFETIVFYVDRGWSGGMLAERALANNLHKLIVVRRLDEDNTDGEPEVA